MWFAGRTLFEMSEWKIVELFPDKEAGNFSLKPRIVLAL
jgi:hypothetical protein